MDNKKTTADRIESAEKTLLRKEEFLEALFTEEVCKLKAPLKPLEEIVRQNCSTCVAEKHGHQSWEDQNLSVEHTQC